MNTMLDFASRQLIETGQMVHARSLCPLIMAGDPTLDVTRKILQSCVDLGVGMVELCVPFKNAFTDGETLIKAHNRALEHGATLEPVIDMASEFTDRIKIVLLADSSHTLRPYGFEAVCKMACDAGMAGILPHGLPPKMTSSFQNAAFGYIPTVGTIYSNATPDTRRRVLEQASAFIYLVSAYGRSGGASKAGDLSNQIDALRSKTDLPIAIGFGLKTKADVRRAFQSGCDIAIVGSAISGVVEQAIEEDQDPADAAARFIASLNREATR
ncbi:tryptophan synthase subunit alpha [Litoreibacter janthinus]|uniref:tryptophan synthase n=1 Tax=Litoreibacter janthinus TaxID=670154 RepID=A0A1I6GDB8_9RHOB|nr:tryptophan synthase subunit alpha [Litoreibacter janthinus]SFR40193.1 tryptophan synthase, alpha chain [Litoreibacter janthinus]